MSIKKVDISNSLAIWHFTKKFPFKEITKKEINLVSQFPQKYQHRFKFSRGCIRYALSNLFNVPPLDIPLIANPGKRPFLSKGWGFLSISFTYDAFLMGWYSKEIGVDMERKDRYFDKSIILNGKLMPSSLKDKISNLNDQKIREKFLKNWVIKEAAIKWQNGNIAEDLMQWEYSEINKNVSHKSLGLSTNVYFTNYRKWYIAIAYDDSLHRTPPIICMFN